MSNSPAPQDLRAVIALVKAGIHYPDNGHHHCRSCRAGTSNGWEHDPHCRIRREELSVEAARKALDELEAALSLAGGIVRQTNEDLARTGELDVQPSPQHASANEKD